jgi:Rrf2 family transcriptional regulator, nitric oxide-sensitive transcriptional repressor
LWYLNTYLFFITKKVYTFAYSNTYLLLPMSKILNISEAATIALHSMGLIARSEQLMNAQEVADVTGFSKNHIAKILQQLVKNGFLLSTRGPKGGFLISEKAKNASMMEIYRLIEGEVEENICKNSCERCPFKSCLFGGLEHKFSNEFISYLSNKKISDL